MLKTFEIDNWSGFYEMTDKGGLVIQTVSHLPYRLANDIRLTSIWVNPDDENKKQIHLGDNDFFSIDNKDNYETSSEITSEPPFDKYPKLKGLQAKYTSKKFVYEDDNDKDDAKIEITQKFVFTKYDKNPPHEPGGVLTAARLFPLTQFKYTGKKVKSIRFDYRLNLSLNYFLVDKKTGKDLGDPLLTDFVDIDSIPITERFKVSGRPNKTGIFRDQESIKTPPSKDLDALFRALEKPVLFEILGTGLINGIPGTLKEVLIDKEETPFPSDVIVTDVIPNTWDNIHQWSGYKQFKKSPSTPGAFHAAHIHWRWGNTASNPNFLEESIIYLGNGLSMGAVGEIQFKGEKVVEYIGGPLIDPKIPNQSIKFAISKANPSTPPKSNGKSRKANDNPSEPKFEELFLDLNTNKPLPEDISIGDDVVIWISITVKNEPIKKPFETKFVNPPSNFIPPISNLNFPVSSPTPQSFNGNVFIHGLYFAHEPESLQNTFKETIGKDLQKPKYDKYPWRRDP